jgi:UDP-3-O-[3-hydroxymyristoyl] glucosamine N-acyltransferase
MAKRQFFDQPKAMTVGEIVTLTGAQPRAGAELDHVITDVAPLDLAGPGDLSYFESAKYKSDLSTTQAGAVLMPERFEKEAPADLTVLWAREPYRAFVAVASKFYPKALRPFSSFDTKGVAAGASVHAAARLETGVTVDPGAVVGPGAAIGAGTVIGANAVIGPGVHIGRDCAIGPGASIIHALIGDRVLIHAGCRIGQDGFGFVMGAQGHVKVPQVGRVIIQDNVEIGANSTIDRGGMRDTVIGEGTKIDNLVQIGHNVTIGRHCIIIAQCGLSGSVTVGDRVLLGGQVGIADHLTIGEGAQIGAQSGVMSNIPAGEKWLGFPARPRGEFLRAAAASRKRS